jgi:hypothetical protein
MTIIEWGNEDKDMPPLMAKWTYINNEGDEASLKSDKNSVLNSRGYKNEPDKWQLEENDGPTPLIQRYEGDESSIESDESSVPNNKPDRWQLDGPPPLIPRFVTHYNSKDNEDIELSNMDKERTDKIGPKTWLAHSGASCHLTNSESKLAKEKHWQRQKIGKMRQTIIQKNGDTVNITLTEVKYVEDLWVNLFSMSKGLKNGFNIGKKGINIFLMKGKTAIVFNKVMQTNKGFILGLDMLPSTRKSCVATMMLDRGKNIPVHLSPTNFPRNWSFSEPRKKGHQRQTRQQRTTLHDAQICQ